MILLEASAVSAARLIAAVARHASADARPGQPDVVGLTWMWCSNAAGGALWETLVGEVGVRQYVQVGPGCLLVATWQHHRLVVLLLDDDAGPPAPARPDSLCA